MLPDGCDSCLTVATVWCQREAMVVPATLRSATELVCVSPAMAVGTGPVQLELTLNADLGAFAASGPAYTYYAPSGLHVSLVWPVAGPRDGGSVLDVTGAGFADLGGVYCRFGCGGAVNATLVSASLLRCVSPACAAPPTPAPVAALWPARRQDELVQVTLNAQEYTTSTATFSAYEQSLVRVSALVPHGGPLAGGTRVVVLGAGLAAFATDHLKCRFGSEVVAAELVNETALVCTSLARGVASLDPTEVTLNGDVSSHLLTADGVVFDYYDASAVAIASTEPLGGPAAGGTVVTVRGAGFVDRGGVYCRFGRSAAADAACDACSEQFEAAGGCPALLSGNAITEMLPDGCDSCLTVATVWCQREAMVVPATLRSTTELVCVSPAMAVGTGPVQLELTLNADLGAFAASGPAYTYFAPSGLHVSPVSYTHLTLPTKA